MCSPRQLDRPHGRTTSAGSPSGTPRILRDPTQDSHLTRVVEVITTASSATKLPGTLVDPDRIPQGAGKYPRAAMRL